MKYNKQYRHRVRLKQTHTAYVGMLQHTLCSAGHNVHGQCLSGWTRHTHGWSWSVLIRIAIASLFMRCMVDEIYVCKKGLMLSQTQLWLPLSCVPVASILHQEISGVLSKLNITVLMTKWTLAVDTALPTQATNNCTCSEGSPKKFNALCVYTSKYIISH